MSPVQIESGAPERDLLACEECAGEGTVGMTPEGCTHAGWNCPCGVDSAPCPRCEGSGIEPCDWCADRPAVVVSPAQDRLCAPCEAQRQSECATCGTARAEEWIVAEHGTRYCASCGGTECELCDGPIERGARLCSICSATCAAHGALDRERARQERVA